MKKKKKKIYRINLGKFKPNSMNISWMISVCLIQVGS